MKRLTLITLCLILIVGMYGQELDFSLDNIHNKAVVNPAYSGKNDFITFNLTYKKDWIYPGAPDHGTLWISGKLTEHMGTGLQISSRQEGLFRKTMVALDYFYRITISKYNRTYMSFGLSGALVQDFFNINQAHVIFNDPYLNSQGKFNRYYPQAAAGIMIYNDIFEFGIAATRLLPYSGYFFGNYRNVLPPAVIAHGIYYYENPMMRTRYAPEFIAIAGKDNIFVQPTLNAFLKKQTIKFGGGFNLQYIPNYHTFKVGALIYAGFKIGERYFITYQFDLQSINMPAPLLTKLGNSISIRMDIYPHQYNMPDYF